MSKKDIEAKIRRIEKAIATIDETLADLKNDMEFDYRCNMRMGRKSLEWSRLFHQKKLGVES